MSSFLPLEKKPFFFLACTADAEGAGVSRGEERTSAAAGSGAGVRSGVGLAAASSCRSGGSFLFGIEGSAGRQKAPSSADGTKSCGSEEEVQVS